MWTNPDLVLARKCLLYNIDENERIFADKGYNDRKYFINPKQYQIGSVERNKIVCILARHETVNSRIKQFKILTESFRHNLSLHPICFHAIANIVQIQINSGETLFQIE